MTENDQSIPLGEWICNWVTFLYKQSNATALVTEYISVIWGIWTIRNNAIFRNIRPNPLVCISLQASSANEVNKALSSGDNGLQEASAFSENSDDILQRSIKELNPIQLIGSSSLCDMVIIEVDATWKDDLSAAAGRQVGWLKHQTTTNTGKEGLSSMLKRLFKQRRLASSTLLSGPFKMVFCIYISGLTASNLSNRSHIARRKIILSDR